jgi:hypothetical protein
MKKSLLLLIIVAFASYTLSAQVAVQRLGTWQNQKCIADYKPETAFVPLKPFNPIMNGSKDVTQKRIGTSVNSYTLLSGENHNLTAVPALNLVMFTHRAGGPYGGNGGDLRCHFTTDYGLTWDSVVFPQADASHLMRYPGGAVYNPSGNTTPDNAYVVVSGPMTDGSTSGFGWINSYFTSNKFDETVQNVDYVPMLPDTFAPAYLNLNVYDGGKVRVGGVAMVEATSGSQYHFTRSGVFAGNTITWNGYNRIYNLFKKRTFSNAKHNYTFNSNIIFENNGDTGYFYTIGRDSLNDPNNASQPIVWKTNDGGVIWNKLPVYDFSFVQVLQDSLWPTKLTWGDPVNQVIRPEFPAGATAEEGSVPCAIDAHGNLHLGCIVEGCSSSDPDSLDYRYILQPFMLFDITLSPAGIWGGNFVSYLGSKVVRPEDGSWGSGSDAVGWDHSIHITRSPDGNKIFYTWLDTDTVFWSGGYNIAPDIMGTGFDIATGEHTIVKNFTKGGNYDALNFFMNNSDVALVSGSTYKIPTTLCERGSTPDQPVYHLFIDGVAWDQSDFSLNPGIKENSTADMATVRLYPNPVCDYLLVNLDLKQKSNIDVAMINLVGQQVFSKSYGTLDAGSQKLRINTSNFNSGIYFISIRTGNKVITNKIIVE